MPNSQRNEEAFKKRQLLGYQKKQQDDVTSSPVEKIIILPYYDNPSSIDETEGAVLQTKNLGDNGTQFIIGHSYSDVVNLVNLESPVNSCESLKEFGERSSRVSANYVQVSAEENLATCYDADGKIEHSSSIKTNSAFSFGNSINNQVETRLRSSYESVKEILDNTIDRFLIQSHDQNHYIPEIAISSNDVIMSTSSRHLPLLQSKSNILEEFVHDKDDEFGQSGNDNKNIEPTVSELERGIALGRGTTDNKKFTNLQLPPEMIPATSSHCEREIVGDDAAKTNTHILCECDQPGVAGGAVPVVMSFTLEGDDAKLNDEDKSNLEIQTPLAKEVHCEMDGAVGHKSKSSLIPKLSSSYRSQKPNPLKRTERDHCLVPPQEQQFPEKAKTSRNVCSTGNSAKTNKYSPILTKKNHKDKSEGPEEENGKGRHCRLRFDDIQFYKELKAEFSKAICRLSQDASKLSEVGNLNGQIIAVNTLHQHMASLKKLGDQLKSIQTRAGSDIENRIDAESNKGPRCADNHRIHIRILPNKSAINRRKTDHTKVQAHNDTDVMPSDVESLTKPCNEEACLKGVDSMDGMFIPSLEEPPKMTEDDDDDGLAITIKFPQESQETANEKDNSHLSLAISNISTEALGHLKRCPKEFTLHVDFVQRKMFFQSGKSTPNNCEIDQDLKISDGIIDSKQSDIINIKSPTECLYTSQIIPVEGAIRTTSMKLLKSTDSELFNVVSLPVVNRGNSVDTKSCITFKNMRRVSSESFLPDRTYYKSMPQIPSLTNILEEPALEAIVSGIKTAMLNADRKPRNRSIQKKRTNTSLENVLNDTP